MADKLIQIGESIHASIPKTGEMMLELARGGAEAYQTGSEALDYVRSLIEKQAIAGASYIAVNVDAFAETDPALAVESMRICQAGAEMGQRRTNLRGQQQRCGADRRTQGMVCY